MEIKNTHMAKYFLVSGYYKQSRQTFVDEIVKDTDEVIEGEDDIIFLYGIQEWEIQRQIDLGEHGDYNFVIVSYERSKLNPHH